MAVCAFSRIYVIINCFHCVVNFLSSNVRMKKKEATLYLARIYDLFLFSYIAIYENSHKLYFYVCIPYLQTTGRGR